MHQIYLPFNEKELLSHFAKVKKNGEYVQNKKHLKFYKDSIKRYKTYIKKNPSRKGKPFKEMKLPCQIEKDERFWIAACMMTIFRSNKRSDELTRLFKKGYGEKPPIESLKSWDECFGEDLYFFFEPNLPSPISYKEWLKNYINKRQFIPYILKSADGKTNLEGATNVDAILLNSKNGFAVIIEAKVLSDISYGVRYDTMRNQIARNIDVMLEKNENLCEPLNKRDPEKTLFLLITPEMFKKAPLSRLYSYKFLEYKNNSINLAEDLPHRPKDWNRDNISKRLGWLTWEDFNKENQQCCQWLNDRVCDSL